MQFSIAMNMLRGDPGQDMREVIRHALDMVHIAEEGGMETAWAAEHHCIEITIAPNPFTILANWAAHTSRIRLGVGVVVAAYWHPIKLAEESALVDLYSDGRLELGIARGAFQYEFDRMAGGLTPEEGRSYLFEMLPLLKKLWAGDVEHRGEHWQFPKATSVPKPVQKPHPPLWIAARDPASFDYSIKTGVNIMSTPLGKPIAEVRNLAGKLATALEQNPGSARPRWLVLRSTGVYEREADGEAILDAALRYGRRFEGLFSSEGNVENGFPVLREVQTSATGSQTREGLRESMVLGTPEQVVEQLKEYEAIGVDSFCYGGNYEADPKLMRRSLELFVERVMPAFRDATGRSARAAS